MSDFCPKCGTPKTGDSCPKCGLIFEKFDPAVLEHGVPPSLIDLYKHVEENWDEKARHALFVEQAIASGHTGYAASRYRKRGDDPMAAEQLERLSKRLELTMTAGEPGESTGKRKGGLILLLLIIFAAALLGLFLVSKVA